MAYECQTPLESLTISVKKAYKYVGIPSLVQDWLYAARRAKPGEEQWLEIVQVGGRGRETRIDTESLLRAYALFKSGIRPPHVPSRCQRKITKIVTKREHRAKMNGQ